MQATNEAITLPVPSKRHATCAWCGHTYPTIVELIDHVDNGHIATCGAVLAS